MKAVYLGLFEAVGKGCRLLQREAEMVFRGFPSMRRSRDESRDRLRQPTPRPKRHRSGINQLNYQRIILRGLRLLPENDQPFDHMNEQVPGTRKIIMTDARQPLALLIKERQRGFAIAAVGKLQKERSNSVSPHRDQWRSTTSLSVH